MIKLFPYLKRTVPYTLYLIPLFLLSCGSDPNGTPKPKGYFRIDLPEKHYTLYNNECPFSFEMPDYAVIEHDTNSIAEPCWINVNYQRFHAKLHLSYKPVNKNLDQYLQQSRSLAIQHQVKASGMKESPVLNDSAKVYGLIYEFSGNAASSLQFYLTDTLHHFIRGALYFFARPNSDSIAPVYDFLQKDIYHMIETFRWRNDVVLPETNSKIEMQRSKEGKEGEKKTGGH